MRAATQELRERLAENREALKDAANEELQAWRARLDHLAVQADLGRMQARDELEDLRGRAERSYATAKAQIERIADQGEESLDVVREGAERTLDDLRRTIRELRDLRRSAA